MSIKNNNKWMPREKWELLKNGTGCSICKNLHDNLFINDDGYKIIDLSISELRLNANQFIKGYSVLFCSKHVLEPYHLDTEEQELFYNDLSCAGLAIERVFSPIKMNLEMQGNSTPHLHCHIKPRYYGDIAPGIPIDQNYQKVLLTEEEYIERVSLIRSELEKII